MKNIYKYDFNKIDVMPEYCTAHLPDYSGELVEYGFQNPNITKLSDDGYMMWIYDINGITAITFNNNGKLHSFNDKPSIYIERQDNYLEYIEAQWCMDNRLHRLHDAARIMQRSGSPIINQYFLNGIEYKDKEEHLRHSLILNLTEHLK